MMKQACKIIGFCMLFLSSGALAAGEETGPATKSWDDYRIITERNIFSRYRTKTIPMSQVKEQVVVVPEQSYYTLRGVTKQTDGHISFIEDSRTAAVTRFRNGDSIAEGRITAINMDYISYENAGKTLKVEIGMNLEGQVSGPGTQYLSSGFGRAQGNAGFPVMGQAQGTGQVPGMGQSQTGGQFQGRGQVPAMGQIQSTGQGASTGQTQANGQQQGMGQRPAMGGQSQRTGQAAAGMQPQAMGQSQQAGQAAAAGQKQTTVNSSSAGQAAGAAVQPAADTDDIMQRLKERRKKELE